VGTYKQGKYNPNIRKELDSADWGDISFQLLRYSVSKAKMLHAIGIADLDHQDLIQEAISLAYGVGPNDTYRNWNREIYPDLADFLKSVIRSIANHKSMHHIKFKSESSSIDDDSSGDKGLVTLSPKNPEEIIKEKNAFSNLKEAIYQRVKGDEEIGMVLLCLEDGTSKIRHIAKETGYDVNKVNNALRRLKRKIKDLLLKPE